MSNVDRILLIFTVTLCVVIIIDAVTTSYKAEEALYGLGFGVLGAVSLLIKIGKNGKNGRKNGR